MDSLDLLRSLTNGVNSKVSSNSSETEGVSYKVDTSLRGRKKSNTPIQSPSDDMKKVRDTYSEEVVEEEIIEEEIIEEDIIEEEIIEEVQSEYSDYNDSETVNDEEPIFDIESDEVETNYNCDIVEELIEEVIEEEIIEEVIEDISDVFEHAKDAIETTKKENEHKLEDTEIIINEPIINIPEKKKIDRCGNPFKRGPRNKNKEQKNKPSKVQQVLSELKEKENENLLDLNLPIEDKKEEKVEEIKTVEPIIEEVSSDLEIEDMLLQSVFDELEEESLGEKEQEDILISEDTSNEEEISNDEKISTSIEEPKENKVDKKPVFEEVVFGEDVDFSFEDLEKKEDVDSTKIEDVNETEDKFKNCKYYGGMSVEEFLRENPNYREAMYVEYFYSKELLEELKMKGIILYKKGIYRL